MIGKAASPSGDGISNNYTNSNAPSGLTPEASQLAKNKGFIKRVVNNPYPVSAINSSGVESGLNPFGWVTQRSAVSNVISQQNGKGAFVTTGSTGNVQPAAAGQIAGTWYHLLKIRLEDLHPLFQ